MNDHSVERLRFLAGTDDVEFVTEPLEAVVVGIETREELRPQTIIRIGSLYLGRFPRAVLPKSREMRVVRVAPCWNRQIQMRCASAMWNTGIALWRAHPA